MPSTSLLDNFRTYTSNFGINDQKNAAALRILVQSFGQFDDGILLCWKNKCPRAQKKGQCRNLSRSKLIGILRAFPTEASVDWRLLVGVNQSPKDYEETANERGDVLLSSIWLQNRLWHLALTHGLLSVQDNHDLLDFEFPVRLAERALQVGKIFRVLSFEGHGQGLVASI